jgi:hypothetical protein
MHRREKLDTAVMAAFIARDSEPTAGEVERSGEGEVPSRLPDYDNTIRQRGGSDE